MWIRVDLDGHAGIGGFLQHGLDIDSVGIPGEQQSTRGMREHGHVRIVHGAQHPLRHRIAVHLESRVNRRDDIVEAIEQLCVIVQPAVGENVRLDAFQHAKIAQRRVQCVDLVVLFEHGLARDPRRVKSRLRVVGDSDVTPSFRPSGACHLRDGGFAVGVLRMAVENTLEVRELDQMGKCARRGGFDLAESLSQLRRNLRERRRGIYGGFVIAGYRPPPLVQQGVAGETHPPRCKPPTDGLDVVRASGRAPECDGEVFGLDAIEVHPRAVDVPNAHRATGARCGTNAGDAREGLRHLRRRVRARGDDVDVGNHFTPAPDRTGDLGADDVRMGSDGCHQRVRLDRRVRIQRHDARVAHEPDALQDFLGGFRAHAFDFRETSVLRGRLEVREGGDANLRMQLVNLLDAKARNAHQFEQPFRRRFTQLFERPRFTGLHEIADDGQCRRPEPPDLRELARAQQRAQIVGGEGKEAARGRLVRARFEPILARQLEESRDLRQHVRGGARVHARNYPFAF